MARSITFVIEGDVNTLVQITENADGTLTFDISLISGSRTGDLRAIFFDLSGFDSSVGGLTAVSTADYYGDVTDQSYNEGGVDTLGQDANVKGSVSNELGDFDVGIEFGTSGIAEDDIQQTSFILAWDGGDLTIDMLDLSDFGIRYTSVGEDGGTRTDSVKIGDHANGVAYDDVLTVDENDAITSDLLTNDTNGDTNVVIGAAWDGGTAFTLSGSELTGDLVMDGKTYGTVSILADGTVTVDADGADVDSLAEGEQIDFTFTYTTEALDGSLATADTTVTINGLSDANPILADPYNTISVGTTGGTRLISVDPDGMMNEFAFETNNGGFAYDTALGDINGDGELDLLMSGDWSGAFIYYGDGAGGFTDSGERFSGQFQSQVAIDDIDNDGDGDIYLQNGRGPTEVWRNDSGNFTQVLSYDNVSSDGIYQTTSKGTFEDVNGDGFDDLLITNVDSVPIADALFLNDGSGNLTEVATILPTGTGFANATLADVNSDGAVDYVRGTATGISVALNDGSGNFTSSVSDLGEFNGYVGLADFNGDGILDSVRADPDGGTGIGLWIGDGAGDFVFDSTITTDQQGYSGYIEVGDFSGDGIADLAYTSRDGSNSLHTMVNDGTGNFTETDVYNPSGYVFGMDGGLL